MTQPTSTLPLTTGTTTWPSDSWAPPTTPPPSPPAKRKIGRYIVGGVVLLFIVAGLAGSGTKKDTTTSNGVVTTPATTATPAATTPVTTGTAVGTTFSVGTWAKRYGADDAETLSGDLTALMADASAGDVTGMGSSCRTFQRHLTTAASHLPTPDAQLTGSLRSAYGYFGQAATACTTGIDTSDPDELSKMMTYLPLGTDALTAASARLTALS